MRLRTRRRLSASVALALALGIAAGGSALPALAATGDGSGTGAATGSGSADRTHYSSKTPYAPQGTPADLAPAPAGFAPVYTESVARHGSRALSSFKYDSLTTQVWEQARSEGALTTLGETLGPEVQKLTAANQKLGYGNLTGQGADQHRGIGARVVQRLPTLFAGIDAGSDTVALESSGEARATASGKAFAEGLKRADPLLASHLPKDIAKDPDTLYFHKSAANADYQAYEDGPAVTAAVDAIYAQPRSHEAARRLLERIYTPAFVDRLAAGQYHFVDGGDGGTHVDDELDAAMMLYNLYIIAPDMTEEVSVDFDRYFTSAGAGDDADTEWFAYLLDAEDFYSKGPAFQAATSPTGWRRRSSTTSSTRWTRASPGPPRRDLPLRARRDDHPVRGAPRLPGSTQPVTPEAPYTYATNAWRGETVTPMAANVQWDVYRDATGRAIVRMLYDEKAIPFRAGCAPIAPGSLFYDAGEVRRCLTAVAVVDPGTTAPGASDPGALPGSPAAIAAADASAARGDTLAATGMSADELPFLAVLAFALGAAGITAVGVVRRPRRERPADDPR
ncbi:Histidine phosphatase superfamily (branch 2) [Clavibacter michiganensis subsp. michiganensis]|uniref:Multiple inositol polyphosphate phosphatase 1 n=1 Tax=Clavibacter michiganensis subsp. michiganensis TaxID=33013 RepID=A0A251XNS6_CLAMM|nr:Histidine phosphatase superfamily (branch 2) [Clavibacter michiganensis subsp. michiganensis]OUE05086.1 Histidine phosphatase superfamily (branch 2) [Clavibacter michiganensis subsp. michiganensis]